jgi:hypothetical protein
VSTATAIRAAIGRRKGRMIEVGLRADANGAPSVNGLAWDDGADLDSLISLDDVAVPDGACVLDLYVTDHDGMWNIDAIMRDGVFLGIADPIDDAERHAALMAKATWDDVADAVRASRTVGGAK